MNDALRAASTSLLLSLAAPSASETEPLTSGGEALTLDVLLYDPDAFLGEQRTDLHDEVERLLSQAGLRVRWLPADEVYESKERTLPLRATLLDREPTDLELRSGVMGVTPGQREGQIFLFLPAIRRTLRFEPAPGEPSVSVRRIRARAVARVLVHEMVHFVAPGRPHARSGLMSERLDQRTLIDPEVRLDLGSRQALLNGLLRRGLVASRD